MLKKLLFLLSLILFTLFQTLNAQEEEAKEVHPYKKLTKKFIGNIKRNEFNKNSSFFDSTKFGKIMEFIVEKSLEDFNKNYGNITAIEKTEVDTQGCKMASYTYIKTAKGKATWYILFDQAQRISNFIIDTFQNQKFYQNQSLFKNYSRKNIQIETNPFVTLPGYLYQPNNIKTSQAVVMIQGSGPSDRHETIGSNKIFLDIIMPMLDKGISVLVYDKRSYVYQAKMLNNEDTIDYYDETINDAVAAINFLKKQPNIDSTKISLIGHSLGGKCAPIIATKISLNKLIMLAAPVRPLIELLPEQIEYIANIDAVIDENEKTQINQLKWIKNKILSPDYTSKSKITIPGTTAKYWVTDKNFDNLKVAQTLKLPTLLIQGGRDYNVPLKDYNLWIEGMKNKPNFKPVLFDDLDHLFFTGSGLANPKDIAKPNHVSTKVINEIITFLKN